MCPCQPRAERAQALGSSLRALIPSRGSPLLTSSPAGWASAAGPQSQASCQSLGQSPRHPVGSAGLKGPGGQAVPEISPPRSPCGLSLQGCFPAAARISIPGAGGPPAPTCSPQPQKVCSSVVPPGPPEWWWPCFESPHLRTDIPPFPCGAAAASLEAYCPAVSCTGGLCVPAPCTDLSCVGPEIPSAQTLPLLCPNLPSHPSLWTSHPGPASCHPVPPAPSPPPGCLSLLPPARRDPTAMSS